MMASTRLRSIPDKLRGYLTSVEIVYILYNNIRHSVKLVYNVTYARVWVRGEYYGGLDTISIIISRFYYIVGL